MLRLHTTILVLALLSGCEQADKPRKIWELASQGLYAAAVAPSGGLVIAGSLHHGASLWKTPANERLYNWSHESGQYTELVAASFSPDATRAITTDPRTLVLWDTSSGQALNYWGTPGTVLDVALFSDNRQALLGLDNHSALVFDAVSGAYRQTLLHQGDVGSVALSEDGALALTGSDDNTAVLWRTNDATPMQTFNHDNPVRLVALSRSGRYSFTAAQGDLVALWDNESGQQLAELHNGMSHGVLSADFSSDERLLVVGYTNRQIKLFNVATGTQVQRWLPDTRHALRPTGSAVIEVGFTDDSRKILAVTGDGRLLELVPG